MTLRQYLLIMLIGTVLCWLSWGFVIMNIDPFNTNNAGFFLFYLSSFFSLLGTLSIVSFFVHRYAATEQAPMFRHVQRSFRDAVIISFIIIFLLILRSSRVLTAWNLIALMLLLIFIVSFVISTKKLKKIDTFDSNSNF